MNRSEMDQWSMAPPQGTPPTDHDTPGVGRRLAERANRALSARKGNNQHLGQPAQETAPSSASTTKQAAGSILRKIASPAPTSSKSPKASKPNSTGAAMGPNQPGQGSPNGKAGGAAAKSAGKAAAQAISKKAAMSAGTQAAAGAAAGAATGGVSVVAQAGVTAAKKAAKVVTSRVQAQAQARATGRNAKDIRKENRSPTTKLLMAAVAAVVALATLFMFIIVLGMTGQHPSFTSPGATLTSNLKQQQQAPSLWIQDAIQAGQDTSTPWPILLAIGYVTTEWGQVNPYGGTTNNGTQIGQLNSATEGAGPLLLSENFVGNNWPTKLSTAMNGDPLIAMEALGSALSKTGQQAAADQGLAYGTIVTDPFGTGGAANDSSSGTQKTVQPDTASPNMKAWVTAVQNLQPDIEPGICQSMAGGMPSPTYIYQCGQGGSNKGTPPILDWTTFGKPTNPQGVAQTDFADLVVTQEAPLLAGFTPASMNIPGLGVTVSPNGTLIVPPNLLPIFQAAAATCPGLSWTLLAADSYQESRWNTTAVGGGPTASSDGLYSYGMAQMEMRTFQEYSQPVPADMAPNPPQGAIPPTPFDPWDAEFAAARLLCADGVATNPQAALGGYNAGTPNTWDTPYIDAVLQWQSDIEAGLAAQGAPTKATTPQLAQLLTFAVHVIGTPYVWGGTGIAASGGFDCSGLTQAAAASAGLTIPRTSEAQWAALTHTNTPTPGDLVFFYFASDHQPSPDHVGIYIGNNQMIDAPTQGQTVRVDPIWTANLVGYAIP